MIQKFSLLYFKKQNSKPITNKIFADTISIIMCSDIKSMKYILLKKYYLCDLSSPLNIMKLATKNIFLSFNLKQVLTETQLRRQKFSK